MTDDWRLTKPGLTIDRTLAYVEPYQPVVEMEATDCSTRTSTRSSVEQLIDPSLRGKPIAVGGGVVLAASYEARAFGVRGGMPGRRARELCPQLVFVSGHFEDYRHLGDAAIRVISDFAPCRTDFDRRSIRRCGRLRPALRTACGDCAARFPPPSRSRSWAYRSPSASRAPSTSRKSHRKRQKPDGLAVVDTDRELEFLHGLPVELMWGVGPVSKARLAKRGISTIGQLARTPENAGSSGCSVLRPDGS